MSRGNYLTRVQYYKVANQLQQMAASNGLLIGKTFAQVAGLVAKETGVPLTEQNLRTIAKELRIKWAGLTVKSGKAGIGNDSFVAKCFRRMDRIDAALALVCKHLGIEMPEVEKQETTECTPAVSPQFVEAAQIAE